MSELKSRLWFVLLGILIYRLGTHIPVPGLDPGKLASYFNQQQNTLIGFFNMFSGGALSRLSVFAIGIMPYISASIVMQLMSMVVPSLEQLKKEGESGRRKINQYTRYATLFLSTFQALGVAKVLVGEGIAFEPGITFYFTTVVTLVTGTMFLMWLGEQMTERGIGNGISLIIFAGIVSRLPSAVVEVITQIREGQLESITFLMVLILVAAVLGIVVFVERAQRRITVHYPQRTQARKAYAPQSSHLPLKINMSGVIPPIFASSLILLPASIATWFGTGPYFKWMADIGLALTPGQGHPLFLITYIALIVFFAFFYTALAFNPKETSDNLKKSGAYLPGIRPGEQTAKYIDGVMTRLTLIGSMYLVLVCILPEILISSWHLPFYFGGTSLLIIVVVVMDFVAQLQAHMVSRQYDSFLRKTQSKRSLPKGRTDFNR